MNLGTLLGSVRSDSIPFLAGLAIRLGWLQHRYARYYVSSLDVYEEGICLRARQAGGEDRTYRYADIRRVWLERFGNPGDEHLRIDIIAPNLDVIFSTTISIDDASQTMASPSGTESASTPALLQELYDRWHRATWRHYHVVAAVISIDGGRHFLCMQKPDTRYAYTSRHWEFPGGKVEEGETEPEALRRELHEEMDYEVEVGEHLTTIEHDYPDFAITLSCWLCTASTDQFTRREHLDHRWLTPDEMRSLDWCAADAPVIELLCERS